MLQRGKVASDFTATDHTRREVRLRDYEGSRWCSGSIQEHILLCERSKAEDSVIESTNTDKKRNTQEKVSDTFSVLMGCGNKVSLTNNPLMSLKEKRMFMRKKLLQMVAAAAIVLATSGGALAIDINAGPIWNNDDAKAKCPGVCSGLRWNGQWTTTQQGVMSVCGSTVGVDIPIGPIWNNNDAKGKCPAQLSKVTWSGQWTTTQEGKMSVCGCNPPPPVR